MSLVKMNEFDTRDELFDAVTKEIAVELNRSVEKKGMGSLVVPGGTTPAPIFKRLSELSLLWHNIRVLPSDERWVSNQHPASNEKLIAEHLQQNKAKSLKLVGLKTDADTPEQALTDIEQRIAEAGRPFSVVMVGMGNDGHFASLFPGSNAVPVGLDIESGLSAIAVNAEGCPVAGEYTQRVSLTLSALTDCNRLFLVILGKEKRQLIVEALEGRKKDLPIHELLSQDRATVEIYWAE